MEVGQGQISDAVPGVSENLGYLLVQICKAHRNKAQEMLTHIGLHVGQEMLLMHLGKVEGITQTELAEQICIQPATLTRSLDRLARAGLVERRVDAADQRVSRVYLTQQGSALRAAIQQIWRDLESVSFANLTAEERALLRRLLLQVQTNLQER